MCLVSKSGKDSTGESLRGRSDWGLNVGSSRKARETRGEDNQGAQGIADLVFGKDCKSLQRVGVRRRMERRRFQDGRRPLLSRSWPEQDLRVEEAERRMQKFLRATDLQADMTGKDHD